jgi:hypothetical protein
MVSPATDPADDSRAHTNAARACSFALTLDDGASPGRVDAVISLLVQQLAADPAGITAAAAVCQARHRDGGVGYDRAADLLGNAVSAVREAGGDTDDAAASFCAISTRGGTRSGCCTGGRPGAAATRGGGSADFACYGPAWITSRPERQLAGSG